MIPWIIAACFASVLVLAALMAVILGPALIRAGEIMREARAEQATAARPPTIRIIAAEMFAGAEVGKFIIAASAVESLTRLKNVNWTSS